MSYSALKDEFENDFDLSSHLEKSKDDLLKHYKDHYAPSSTPSLSQTSSQASISASSNASPQKNFISRFNRKPRTSTDELLEFWSLPQEDIESCDPLHWWYGRHAQFPNLYRLVRDIFSIPGVFLLYYGVFNLTYYILKGSAVAVEQIFSGGRDTISLRRASLKPETIRVFMLVKKKLHLEREKSKTILRRK
jgi:hAT family C-terminal dimerisation region